MRALRGHEGHQRLGRTAAFRANGDGARGPLRPAARARRDALVHRRLLGQGPVAGLRFVAARHAIRRSCSPTRGQQRPPLVSVLRLPNDKPPTRSSHGEDGLKVAANGRLVSVTEDPLPGRSLTTVAGPAALDVSHVPGGGPYVVVRDALGSLPVNYWSTADEPKVARPTDRRRA